MEKLMDSVTYHTYFILIKERERERERERENGSSWSLSYNQEIGNVIVMTVKVQRKKNAALLKGQSFTPYHMVRKHAHKHERSWQVEMLPTMSIHGKIKKITMEMKKPV